MQLETCLGQIAPTDRAKRWSHMFVQQAIMAKLSAAARGWLFRLARLLVQAASVYKHMALKCK